MQPRNRVLGTLILLAAAYSGCALSKYSLYSSPKRDFVCEFPREWTVLEDSSDSTYTDVTFAGPMDPDFFHGIPSISVRWYSANAPHRLPDGSFEVYSSYKDFMEQMLKRVYGPDGYTKSGADQDEARAQAQNQTLPDFGRISIDHQWEAYYFVAYHNLRAPSGPMFGVVRNDRGERIIRERHAYVLIPMNGGFYAVIYPATKDGFERYKPALFHLINSFRPFKDGPAGGVVEGTSRSERSR